LQKERLLRQSVQAAGKKLEAMRNSGQLKAVN